MKTIFSKPHILGILFIFLFFLILILGVTYINLTSISSNLRKLATTNCENNVISYWLEENFENYQSYINSDNTLLINELVTEYPNNLKNHIPILSNFYPKLDFLNSFIETTTINPTGKTLPQETSITVKLESLKLKKTQVIALSLGETPINCYYSLPVHSKDDPVIISGSLSKEQFTSGIQKRFEDFSEALQNNSGSNFLYFPPETDNTRLGLLSDAITIISNSTIDEIQITEPEDLIDVFKIASFNLNIDEFNNTLNIYYDPVIDNLLFNISELNQYIFTYLKQTGKILSLNCSDCSLAPVSKHFSLSPTYAPQVENMNIPGGGQLGPNALTQLNNLYNELKEQGINISIISAYRSYSNQISTFNYWVSKEMAIGLTRAAAETKANNYSARPGQSEHQLGTTVDLRCNTCNSFDNSPDNLKLYNYLKNNAYKFGFVISYPDNKKELTGYNAEAWHIRYIGVDNATRLYNLNYLNPDNEYYLTQYLIENNLY